MPVGRAAQPSRHDGVRLQRLDAAASASPRAAPRPRAAHLVLLEVDLILEVVAAGRRHGEQHLAAEAFPALEEGHLVAAHRGDARGLGSREPPPTTTTCFGSSVGCRSAPT
jgi:hypothetical protein